MINYNKALKILSSSKIKIKNEIVLAKNSLSRIASKNIYSPSNHPSANNTAFDGFAVNSKETNKLNKKNIKKFKVIRTIAAGDNPNIKNIKKFTTIEVMTGAIIKKPFDTVIPIEQIKLDLNKKKNKYILISKKIKKNEYIRYLGSDYKKGELVIKKGELIEPSHVLALKTLGIKKVEVKKKININFYSTGNEITNKDKIPLWKVRNSNTYYLNSLTKNMPVVFTEKIILKDKDEAKFKKELIKNFKSTTNIIVTSGAVSAGKFDFIPKVIKKIKLKNYFKGVSIRPGKPILFAKFKNNKVFFGLPGNPVSSAACFRFFIMPFLFSSLEMNKEKPTIARLKNSFVKKKFFTRFIKGKINTTNKGIVKFEVLKGQESFKINSLTKSNSWGLFPSGRSHFKKGNLIKCYTTSPFL